MGGLQADERKAVHNYETSLHRVPGKGRREIEDNSPPAAPAAILALTGVGLKCLRNLLLYEGHPLGEFFPR